MNNTLMLQKEKNMISTKCTDAIKAWDEPPPSWSSEMTFPEIARRKPMILSSSLEISYTPLIIDEKATQMTQSKAIIEPTPVRTSQDLPRQSPKEPPASTKPDKEPSGQIQDLNGLLAHIMMGFIALIALTSILVYTVLMFLVYYFLYSFSL